MVEKNRFTRFTSISLLTHYLSAVSPADNVVNVIADYFHTAKECDVRRVNFDKNAAKRGQSVSRLHDDNGSKFFPNEGTHFIPLTANRKQKIVLIHIS